MQSAISDPAQGFLTLQSAVSDPAEGVCTIRNASADPECLVLGHRPVRYRRSLRISPGEYELSYSPACNPVGCTGVKQVTVSDRDVYVVVGRSMCPGDCSTNNEVTIDETMGCMAETLGVGSRCALCDPNRDYAVGIEDLVTVVGAFVKGCLSGALANTFPSEAVSAGGARAPQPFHR